MVLMGKRRAKQREDAVARGLHDITIVAMDRVDHQLEGGIDERARCFGIEVFHQIHRALDIGEERGDGLALTVDRRVGRRLHPHPRGDVNLNAASRLLAVCACGWSRRRGRGGQCCAAIRTEGFAGLRLSTAARATRRQRGAAVSAEALARRALSPALGASHTASYYTVWARP